MLKQIYKQLWNRKRSNGWILLELLLVFCFLWYLVDYMFVLSYNYSLPSYQDTNHTWQVNVAQYPTDHPEFIAEENEPEALEANYARILNHIRAYPGVEAIGVSFHYSTPGSAGYWGTSYRNAADTTRLQSGQIFHIYPGEDFFNVFAYTTGNGRTPISVNDFDWSDPNAIILNRLAAESLFPDGNAAGKRLDSKYNASVDKLVIAVVDNVKKFSSYRPSPIFYEKLPLNAETIPNAEISIRSSTRIPDAQFRESFSRDMANALRIGNFYLQSVFAYNDNLAAQDITINNTRIRISLMLFFVLNLLLCVTGTFWYRINVRKEEIGLREAIGSSRRGIIRLFMLEGLCLLSIVILPAMLIEYQFVHAGLIETFGKEQSPVELLPDRTFLRFLITNAITWVLLAVTILIAIWLPASRATSMEPAEALHYE